MRDPSHFDGTPSKTAAKRRLAAFLPGSAAFGKQYGLARIAPCRYLFNRLLTRQFKPPTDKGRQKTT
jgi:hypothetical protein